MLSVAAFTEQRVRSVNFCRHTCLEKYNEIGGVAVARGEKLESSFLLLCLFFHAQEQ
jgi:hypothetical protein